MQDLGARAREMSAGVVRAIERMSIDPGTDQPHAPNSPGHPSGPNHHPPDQPPDYHGSGSDSGESPRGDSVATLPTASLTPTPELRSGSEH